ncbi:hypothetical protein ACET3Z_000477 [Daucus carota]
MDSSPSIPLPPPPQERYIRSRDHPLFDGMRKSNANRGTLFNFLGRNSKQSISRSVSEISDIKSKKTLTDFSESAASGPIKDSLSDIILEPYPRSSSGRWSQDSKRTSASVKIQSELSIDLGEEDEFGNFSPRASNDESYTRTSMASPTTERSFSMNFESTKLSKIPLPPSAASFYSGYSPQMKVVELCKGIQLINMYLKACKDDVSAGVPGKFLHAVLGQDACDVGSVVSTIMYSFYLHSSLKNDQFCTVPVINMKRADLNSHAELKWLLETCNVDHSQLIFIDEIDLSYYDLFGSLKLVFLNGDNLPEKQEALKGALVEIFNCKKVAPSVSYKHANIPLQDCSCCTVIAEKFVHNSPEILAGRGFSRLLLAGILLDTRNMSSPRCTDKDRYMATLLINGAGRFGCTGLHQILKYKMYDVTDLKVGHILRKDFKKWTRIGKSDNVSAETLSYVGLTSIGISIAQLLAHDETSAEEIMQFQQVEKLRLFVIVSGYYDSRKNFKREILVSAESSELMKNLLQFFNSNASQLPLKEMQQPGLLGEMRAFGIDKVTSRRTIERLLEEFGKLVRR